MARSVANVQIARHDPGQAIKNLQGPLRPSGLVREQRRQYARAEPEELAARSAPDRVALSGTMLDARLGGAPLAGLLSSVSRTGEDAAPRKASYGEPTGWYDGIAADRFS